MNNNITITSHSNPHPYLKCNWFSKIFHTWVTSLLYLASKKSLEEKDLFDILPQDKSNSLIENLELAWENQVVLSRKKKKNPSLILATISVCYKTYSTVGIYIFIYIIRLSLSSLSSIASGKIINLMTNDVATIEKLSLDGHFFWVGILETIVVLSILWIKIGYTILIAACYTIFVLLLQMACGKCIQIIWTKRVRKTDLRIKLMNEIVKSIHLVKMYSWQQPFQQKVENVRRIETYYIIFQSLMTSVKIVNGQAFAAIFFLQIFGLLWYKQIPFDTEFFTIAFVLISYLRHTFLHNFSGVCVNLSQYWAAAKRIQDFLLLEEYHRSNAIKEKTTLTSSDETKLYLETEHLSASWENASFHLQNISFTSKVGELVMVIGPIASGKVSIELDNRLHFYTEIFFL
ncbi:unnamed protein product [Didymodactylos carnosus]|uniref:ABC transmembrane type-1 domain-containing protein n=1 Tax=Didymodactylos carnosus TaxID=1234261 RepID=A0A813UUB9_9BILA|nr:unnamed protein product [Didymodactylos carnosus]CAF0830874.1 unnamed protein product [Didymodactylos carnosus]CAF3600572.1 unnamed protein product [Didymodactylos carnosus]CAF3617935.1 unnamed protein product [Didymodactylos carnosus]